MSEPTPDRLETADGLATRDEALALLNEYTKKPGLIKHALAVEAAVKAYARKLGADERAWGLVALLHDFDYERWPTADDHPYRGCEILEHQGYPEWFRRAILSHADYTGVTRESPLEKVLFAIDELTGLVATSALVRPSRSVMDLTPKSVKKKWKNARFAAAIDRDVITKGAEMLNMDLTDLIADTIEGMRTVATEIGLAGE